MGRLDPVRRDLSGDQRGASSIEYLVVVGLVAVLVIAGLRLFGSSVLRIAEGEADHVASLEGEDAPSLGVDAKSFKAKGGAKATGGVEPKGGAGLFASLEGAYAALSPHPSANGMSLCFGEACVNGMCFAPGTPVVTANGPIAIEAIRPGDHVMSRAESGGETTLKTVTGVLVTKNSIVLDLDLQSDSGHRERIGVTPSHPFHLARGGWRRAGDLAPGDAIATAAGQPLVVVALSTRATSETVYNLEVDGFHTYFVGEGEAWVHNACGPPEGVEAILGNPTPSASDVFSRVLDLPVVKEATAKKGTTQPLPIGFPDEEKLDLSFEQKVELAKLKKLVGVEWTRLVADTRTRLDRRAKGLPDWEPPKDFKMPKLDPRYEDLVKRYQANVAKGFADSLKELDEKGTPLDYLRGEDAYKFKNAYLRYLGFLAAAKAGGDMRTDADGLIRGIKYPDGSQAFPIWEGTSMTGLKIVDPAGGATFYRRFGGTWKTGPTWNGAKFDTKVKPRLEGDGRIVLESPGRTDVRLPDGRRVIADKELKTERVLDNKGNVEAMGPADKPDLRFKFKWDKDKLIEVFDPYSKTTWKRGDGNVWSNGKDRFTGEFEITEGNVLRVPTEPTTSFTVTEKVLRMQRGDTFDGRVYVLGRDGLVLSQDPDDIKFGEKLAKLFDEKKLPENKVEVDPRSPDRDNPRYKTWENPIVKMMRDAGIATPGTEVFVSSESRRVWDPKAGPIGRIVNPSFRFTTEKDIKVRTITETDLRTGRTTTVTLEEAQYTFLRKKYDGLVADGKLPPGQGFGEFVRAWGKLKQAQYQAQNDQIYVMVRALIGDTNMIKYGFGIRRDLMGKGNEVGLMNMDRIFFDPQKEKNFRMNVLGRAKLLLDELIPMRTVVERRLALAKEGRWAELEAEEGKDKDATTKLPTLIKLIQNFEDGLPDEKDLPGVLRVTASIKRGASDSFKKLIGGFIEHPTFGAAFIALSIAQPELGFVLTVAMMAPEVAGGVFDGVEMIKVALEKGDDDLLYKGIAKLAEAGTDVGVIAIPAILHAAEAPRAPEPVKGLTPKEALLRRIAANDPELAGKLGKMKLAEVEKVLKAWEVMEARGIRGKPVGPEFMRAKADAFKAFRELAEMEGGAWKESPFAAERPAIKGRPKAGFDSELTMTLSDTVAEPGAFKQGAKIKVKRSNGDVEANWEIKEFRDGKVVAKTTSGKPLERVCDPAEILELNPELLVGKEVRAVRSSGDIETGWRVDEVLPNGKLKVSKTGVGHKEVPAKKLVEWNPELVGRSPPGARPAVREVVADGAGKAQAEVFKSKHRLEAGKPVEDGYVDGGRGMSIDEAGKVVSSREVLVVDRARDANLARHLEYARSLKDLPPTERAQKLAQYVDDVMNPPGGRGQAQAAVDAWEPAYRGQEVLIGDVQTLGGGVCRHRALLYKVLADEAGLSTTLVRGNLRVGGNRLGGHAWNEVKLPSGETVLVDVMNPEPGFKLPKTADADIYYGADRKPLYGAKDLPTQTSKPLPKDSTIAISRQKVSSTKPTYEWSELGDVVRAGDFEADFTSKGQTEAAGHFGLKENQLRSKLGDITREIEARVRAGDVMELTGTDGRHYFEIEVQNFSGTTGRTYIKFRGRDSGGGYEIHSCHK